MTTIVNPPERQAKPMLWNGWNFRSQAEAYAAMFLMKIGVAFMYEPEAYELGDGEPTRPDFWLPEINGGVWLEIKGHDSFDDRQVARLSAAQAGTTVYVATAPLWTRVSNGRDTQSMYIYRLGYRRDTQYEFCRCARCKSWTIQYHGYQSRHECGVVNRFKNDPAFAQFVDDYEQSTQSLISHAGEECERFRVWSTVGR